MTIQESEDDTAEYSVTDDGKLVSEEPEDVEFEEMNFSE